MTSSPPTLVARSSSHFSRIARIYVAELELACEFQPVYDINATEAHVFADNPLLRVPSLRTTEGTWFGSLNVCRALARLAPRSKRLIWPEDLTTVTAANAQEVVTDAMGTGVIIITSRLTGTSDETPALRKPFARLAGALVWLESHLDDALASQPTHDVSFLDVSAFCFLSHLTFRGLGTLDAYPRLRAFVSRVAERPSAQATPYRFDVPA